jgi:hypothetical protein
MKSIVERLQRHNLIFQSLKPITPKSLNSRKKIDIYLGVDTQSYYSTIFFVEKKSRIVQKEVQSYLDLHAKLEQSIDSAIKKRYIFIDAPLCSKAKALLESHQWRVWEMA